MSVERRIIGVPAASLRPTHGVARTSVRREATVTAHTAPIVDYTEQPVRRALRVRNPRPSASAVWASKAHLLRVKTRMADAGGESRSALAAYVRRFTLALPLPWARVFGERSIDDVRNRVAIDHATLQILPEDVAFAAVRRNVRDGRSDEVGDSNSSIGVLAVISDRQSREPLGFYVQTLVNATSGCAYDYLDFAVVNPNRGSAIGVGYELTALMDRLADAGRSKESRLKTAWVGRYYWAQKRYDFVSRAERDRVVEYFVRFVHYMKLDEAQLYVELPGEERRPFSFDALEHSWDIAYVASHAGAVEVPGLVAHDQVKSVKAAVGKAFYLGDWNDNVLGQPGADIFVRNWLGKRRR